MKTVFISLPFIQLTNVCCCVYLGGHQCRHGTYSDAFQPRIEIGVFACGKDQQLTLWIDHAQRDKFVRSDTGCP